MSDRWLFSFFDAFIDDFANVSGIRAHTVTKYLHGIARGAYKSHFVATSAF